MQVNQRLYLLSLLQSSGLQRPSLHLLFNALVIKVTYALPAYSGQLTVDDKNRINAIYRKTMRRGLTLTAFDIDKSDCKLFGRSLSQVTVCTSFSLPKPPPTVPISFVRGNIHTSFQPFNIRSLKTPILIVVYLNMSNSITITSCFSLAAYSRFHTLCVIYFVF